ncbi:Cytochrome o ubiquinol oxidase protein CyoD [Candidatus Portiera aleyrodidarum]|uniref:Cytochrome bo3 quinol oxidase subunit 4 n=1 Tax=Candidatus Portiera aleyrodidarum TV TaxID=1297582 RepID=A0A8D3X7H2_9GAMM|nr:cytochrome bo3 quinol oxidase subunit 4 [Candidatus Portiera aleyrodidarum]AGI27142.1 cytochrome bo3 quinol oxidase subunit 4 [Candidatus Portiera aleyrodidarum TV]CEI59116.1 Cytochrome o ubiquinol oxidase protein CyoD [Candidatus Portiera aleyrodidarum]
MKNLKILNEKHIKDCIIGFIISLILTILAYIVVIKIIIVLFAIIQIIVQILFFINIKEISILDKNIYIGSLLFTVIIISIIIGGSLWIMYNINGK